MNQTYPKELTDLNKTNPRNLIGRTEDLQHLRQLLSEEKQITLVNGMGGIGKTTLAEAYVFENHDQYDHIAWITNNSEALSDDFVQHRDLLKNLDLHNAGLEPQPLFEEMMRRMRNFPTKNNLLVIDNAVKAAITPFLKKLPSPPGWHLLVTSRERIPGMKQKDLSFLSPEEANALFKKHCSLIKGEDFIDEITAAVEYHTLTIEILAKTTARMHLTPEQVRNALKTDAETDLDNVKRSEGATIKKVTSFLASIFELSDLSEDEIWMLKQFCCLPPDFFELEFLKDLINPDEEKAAVSIQVLNSLADRGWLLKSGTGKGWKMHRIFNNVLLKTFSIKINEVESIFESIISKLNLEQRKDNLVHIFKWILFAEILIKTPIIGIENIQLADLKSSLGKSYWLFGYLFKAIPPLNDALIFYKNKYGSKHPNTAICYSNLGVIYQALGDYEYAIELHEKAIIANEFNFGAEHDATTACYSNLAVVLQDVGNYWGAKELLEKVKISNEKKFGIEHPYTALSYSNLGAALQGLGDFEGAKLLYEKAILSDEQNFGENHPDLAVRYSNLSSVLRILGDYKKAEELILKAIKIDEMNFGEEHPITLIRYHNYAILLQSLKAFEKALIFSEKSVEISQKILPITHPHLEFFKKTFESIKSDLGKN